MFLENRVLFWCKTYFFVEMLPKESFYTPQQVAITQPAVFFYRENRKIFL